MPTADNFHFKEVELPGLTEGQVLLKSLFISVDPYMRGRMSEAKSYVAPYEVGQPLTGGVVAQVIESRNDKLNQGAVVMGELPWQEYTVHTGKGLREIDPAIAPLSYHLGILGMPGLTAYVGLLLIGKPKEGETVVVSGAAGAVGTVVGQIAKLKGCHVVGIAGSEQKLDYLQNELGFDAGINYKTSTNLREEVLRLCPSGVDVYFDNVGGDVSDAVYSALNNFSRIVICGQIAFYNNTTPPMGPRVEPMLLTKKALMQGFIVGDYASEFAGAAADLVSWLKEGKLQYQETITEGFDNLPEAFLGLFRGENTGKQLVKVAEYSPDK